MSPRTASRWSRRRTVALSSAALLALVAGLAAVHLGGHHTAAPDGPPCLATAAGQSFGLELDQARAATTIAAVGRREGLPDHAVTIAMATALQESGLHNLDYGDRDSRGLFQQRPSQGWGTAEQVSDPVHAASAFYQRLAQVKGWQTMDVTAAAQAVQRSAAPDAYAKWEPQARVLAQVLTGEVPAGLTCRVTMPRGAQLDPKVGSTMKTELGPGATADSPSAAAGWTAAAWLVGHADQLHVTSVTYAGQRWTAKSSAWSQVPGSTDITSRPEVA